MVRQLVALPPMVIAFPPGMIAFLIAQISCQMSVRPSVAPYHSTRRVSIMVRCGATQDNIIAVAPDIVTTEPPAG